MDCYWLGVGTDLALLMAVLFWVLWFRGRRRFRNLREEYQAHLQNMASVDRDWQSFEYERWQRLNNKTKDE